MIFNFDVTGLEVLCTAYLSRDPVLIKELEDKLDIHTDNQKRFGLPSRAIAKAFVFKLLYGASEYGFANDADFKDVSTHAKYWKKVIDAYYEKYNGIYKWHQSLIRTVGDTRMLVGPTGRTFKFEMKRNWKGDLELPITTIKNWIVQGTSADIVSVLRVDLYRRFKESNLPGVLVNTVHDSIVLDLDTQADKEIVDKVKEMFYNVLHDFPNNFEKIFGVEFDLEIRGEMEIGDNMLEMTKI